MYNRTKSYTPRATPNTVLTNLRIPHDLRAAVDAEAVRRGETRAFVIREAIREYLTAHAPENN